MKSTTLAKRLGLQCVNVHFGTFDFTVRVIAGPKKGVQEFVRWNMDDKNYVPQLGNRLGVTFERRGFVPVIWIPRRPRTAREYGTLAHEAAHAITIMLVEWAGMPHTRDSDEAYTHALGHLVTSALEGLR